MTVRLYKSTDASAPSLTGQVGSLIALLDAILVNGYGSQTAAGWTKPYSNSGNQGCYRMSAVTGSGAYLNILDSGPGAGGAREARAQGFNAMSALGTGTGQFPLSGQLAIGTGNVVWRKSATADATARPWACVADETCFYLFVETGDYNNSTAVMTMMFGDIFSMKASDALRAMIIGRNAENTASMNNESFAAFSRFYTGVYTPLNDYVPGHFMNGSWTGVVGSINVGKTGDMTKMQGATYTSTVIGGAHNVTQTGNIWTGVAGSGLSIGMGLPSQVYGGGIPPLNPVDGSLMLSPLWVHHNGCIRGYLKGIWNPIATRPLSHGDTISGAGAMTGKSLLAQQLVAGYNNGTIDYASCLVETSDTWS